jgi:branched-chain amino acid transport system ATP-binding protein
MMLEVQDINVWYGVTEVLRSVSFAVPKNSIVALLGGNGSGKTTVLNTISGMVSPRSGMVRLLGEDITGVGPHGVVRAGMTQVPQGREVFASMSSPQPGDGSGDSTWRRRDPAGRRGHLRTVPAPW